MAVNGHRCVANVRDPVHDIANEVGELRRLHVPDTVRNVDHCRAGCDCRFENTAKIVAVGPGRIHRRELDFRKERPPQLDRSHSHFKSLVPRNPELVVQMNVTRRQNGVKPGCHSFHERARSCLDVRELRIRKRRDLTVAHDLTHGFDGAEVAGRCGREPGLNAVDTEAF